MSTALRRVGLSLRPEEQASGASTSNLLLQAGGRARPTEASARVQALIRNGYQ